MASEWALADRARTAFAAYGVSDGTVLLEGASRALGAPPDASVAVSPVVLGAVGDAFHEAFRDRTDHRTVPARVEAALDDAAAWTNVDVATSEGGSVPLRDVLLPMFYHRFAGFHRAYCRRSSTTEFDG